MSININKFLDKIRAAESRQQRDVILSTAEARDLHTDITKLLLALNESLEQHASDSKLPPSQTMEIEGGRF